MEPATDNSNVTTVPTGVGDAVGVPDRHWFVAIVKHNTEKSSEEKLLKTGYEAYVASQRELRVWRNGRKKTVDRVVIPSTVFVHCTESERREIVALPFINRFMTDKAIGADRRLAVIPDAQMATLRFMLGNSDSPVSIGTYKRGDHVQVVRGNLAGLEGEVIELEDGRNELTVLIDFLGCARVAIDPTDCRRV